MVEWLRRLYCRSRHGGLHFEAYRCTRCGTMFPDSRAAGLLDEFHGFVKLDANRIRDEEAARHREFQMLGYRVVVGGSIVEIVDEDTVPAADTGKRVRVMGGIDAREADRIKREKDKRPHKQTWSEMMHPTPHVWGDVPEPKRAQPIALPMRKEAAGR